MRNKKDLSIFLSFDEAENQSKTWISKEPKGDYDE